MNRLALALLALLAGCFNARLHVQKTSTMRTEARRDSIYNKAVANLDPSNPRANIDTAIANLDSYLSFGGDLKHAKEAAALRTLARNTQQLERVEAALQQARATAASAPATSDGKARETASNARVEEMLKEIQRLKDELAKANEELERIKKRLAAPKP
ncbi:MAG TPA: hypothetical protein VFT29_17830 [Gemmatimonadaceae bacterium]|nr:hypothetical protein [Gemmatimonadaceae bacterium]